MYARIVLGEITKSLFIFMHEIIQCLTDVSKFKSYMSMYYELSVMCLPSFNHIDS